LVFWKLADLTDATGNGYTLTNNGGVTFGPGKIGDAAIFDDGISYLRVDNAAFTGNTFTVAAWFKPTDSTAPAYYLGSFIGWCAYKAPDGTSLEVGAAYTWNFAVPNVFEDNTWVHVVVTVNAGFGVVYVNGVEAGDSSGTPSDMILTGSFEVGSLNNTPYGNKMIDAVGVWPRVLTPTEVSSLYNNGNGLEP